MMPGEMTTLFATETTTILPIAGQPTNNDITTLCNVLYPLLLDIMFNIDEMHNLFGIIEPIPYYMTALGNPFPIPLQPPAYPAIADDASTIVFIQYKMEHTILVQDYTSYNMAKRAAPKFICDATNKIWYLDLCHAYLFYTNITAKQLLAHLDANSRGLHPSELFNLPTNMMGYYANTDSITKYINMLKEAQCK
jgi:hypothetical protein